MVIDKWEDLNDIFDNINLIPFRKSYRTTDEIMKVANVISSYLNFQLIKFI